MQNIENILKEYPLISGVILMLLGFFLIYYKFSKNEFFKKEDDYDTVTGEFNAHYWAAALILIIIGVFLMLDKFK